LIDLGSGVFESATVDTNILLLKNIAEKNKTKAITISKDLKLTTLSSYIKKNQIFIKFNINEPWAIMSPIEIGIKLKIEANGVKLIDWPNIKINRGILTGLNDAFVIDGKKRLEILERCSTIEERKKTEALIRPVLRGKDIRKKEITWNDLFIILSHNGYYNGFEHIKPVKIDEYPSLKTHFDNFIELLEERYDKGITAYNLRDCSYLSDFDKQKIIWPDISTEPSFYLDNQKFIVNNTAYILTGPNLNSIVLFLNSKINKWYFNKISTTLGEENNRYFSKFVGLIPIPFFSFEKIEEVYEKLNFSKEEIAFIESNT
jgi:hypothetical protein